MNHFTMWFLTVQKYGILTGVFCTFGPNLVILLYTSDEYHHLDKLGGWETQTGVMAINGGQN